MKVLVVGSGGREHAIAWKLLRSPQVEQVFCSPGNGGTAMLERCQNLPLSVEDFDGIGEFTRSHDIDLVVVGPEVPLALGITDYLQQQGTKVFGPTRAGAQIEASKAWAKALMQEAQIPTAKAAVFHQAAAAKDYVKSQGAPIVVKANGLAAGKGVTVAETIDQAHSAIEAIFQGQFGKAGFVVIEECLTGQEASVLALTDGLTIRPLLPAQDHKRIGEGDTGENTGGMGVYAPAPIVTPELMAEVEAKVLQSAIATLKKKGIDYRGVLYAGLMISPNGDFKVLEFNCRFGDPETQAILPLLETPLEDLLLACVEQRLAQMPPLAWKSGAAACVVVAAGGYPGTYEKGKVITGIDSAEATGANVFHAGTKLISDLVTDGGRVLGVTGTGENFEQAIALAYQAVNCIKFEKMYYRRDIGYRVKSKAVNF
ncbi:phosphoribosylamine--glycine ligase [Gloeocapsopsis dulcis]|uniref:Phosphoribosylamine--glycine ligase n=1 Tax=Gloeocapsopsis dulcis AAB1 = 1H9 TaxID=1433147 RepID=A0A6N8FTM8_9CHRO|nr:phosphoribosylamine--glycine ligase [Gloeocapsopsis dulcis]MUL35665.1 phosphoribosylamine--glycine ligase [Gloeocapsopsis dulcis AAB1 = 1H9]WNN87435.1 phosphoribosylamine--glycine ligase [Gloeocapsopsis dulcis]